MVHRHINQNGVDLIKSFEGLSLKAYQDVVGYWTIGYGHLMDYPEEFGGQLKDEAEAEHILKTDIKEFERAVLRLINIPLSDNEFAAVVSFTFNLGSGALQRSTLRSKLNRGDKDGASREFSKWVYAGGRKFKGLVRRREAERVLFVS